MAFSESVKDEVSRKAAFRCCRCHQVGIEAHHIIPEAVGGSNDIDNAAPLCPNGHSYFGDNPVKRAEIKKMRDWWYKVAASKYPTEIIGSQIGQKTLENISKKLDGLPRGLSDIEEIRKDLRDLTNRFIGGAVTSANATRAASGLIDAIVSSTSPPEAYSLEHRGYTYGRSFGTVICNKCEKEVISGNYCPNCGNKLD